MGRCRAPRAAGHRPACGGGHPLNPSASPESPASAEPFPARHEGCRNKTWRRTARWSRSCTSYLVRNFGHSRPLGFLSSHEELSLLVVKPSVGVTSAGRGAHVFLLAGGFLLDVFGRLLEPPQQLVGADF
jgi:hypothetical protein